MTAPKTVEDATQFIRGITFKPDELINVEDEDAVVCMRTKNIQRDLDQSDLIAVPRRLVRNPDKFLKSGDTLISSANSWDLVGKCSYVGELNYPATAGGFISIVRPKAKTHPRFLFHWLSSPAMQDVIRNLGRQTTNISNLDVNRFKQLDFPTVEFEEQGRIAAILDKADAICRKRDGALMLAEELLRSTFLAMFGDPATNPNKLPTSPIREFGSVVTGNTPPRNAPENYGDGIEWIKSDNINGPNHYVTEATERLSKIGERICRKVPAGSTLVTCIAGSYDCIGNAAMANRTVAFNQQINAVIPGEGTNAEFFYAQVLVGKKLIQQASTNSMKGMVSKGKFQEIEFLAPNFAEQCRFGEIFRKILAMHSTIDSAAANDRNFFAALSQRAFGGEL